jgi:ribose-phosphate pyrophosphokinase
MINLHDLPVSSFPDGHKHLVIPMDSPARSSEAITASIRNFDDLFLLAQAKRILPQLKYLTITYLLGGRCDRKFSEQEAFDLEIVCDFINSMDFWQVDILQPHSEVSVKLIDNSGATDVNDKLIAQCIANNDIGFHCVVAPDLGAGQWVQHHVPKNGLLVNCHKERNPDSEHHEVLDIMVPDLPAFEDFIILDDLCDGGGTFLHLAKKLRERGAKRVFLVVTHAIFSKGTTVFEGLIDHIYCTNSFDNFNLAKNVTQINVQ